MVERTLDTVINYTVCDHHGNRLEHIRKTKLYFTRYNMLAAAEVQFSSKDVFKFYYFDKGKMFMTEYWDEAGDITVRPYPNGIGFDCYYNVDGRFVQAVLEMLPAISRRF